MDTRAYQIVYTSELTVEATMRTAVLRSIASISQRNNAALGVTGALLVAGDRVVQLLEGEEGCVREVLSRIEADVRHVNVVRLAEVPDGQRSFSEWSMGVRQVPSNGPTAEALAGLLAAYRSAFCFDLDDFAQIVRQAFLIDA
jgi:hypothetical protein